MTLEQPLNLLCVRMDWIVFHSFLTQLLALVNAYILEQVGK